MAFSTEKPCEYCAGTVFQGCKHYILLILHIDALNVVFFY